MAMRGKFLPRHPEKYIGDSNKIFFRSSWEAAAMKFFDSRTSVLRWNSEEISIPYLSPLDNKVHQYYPDFFMEYVDKDGVIHREIVEVKPRHESDSKYAKSDRSKSALVVNEAKWSAASIFCQSHDMKFRVITEMSIFYQGKKIAKARK